MRWLTWVARVCKYLFAVVSAGAILVLIGVMLDLGPTITRLQSRYLGPAPSRAVVEPKDQYLEWRRSGAERGVWIVVASVDIGLGSEIRGQHLNELEWPWTPESVEREFIRAAECARGERRDIPNCRRFDWNARLAGLRACERIEKGTPIRLALVTYRDGDGRRLGPALAPGECEVTLVKPSFDGLATIRQGERLDVILTERSGTAARTILNRVRVAALDGAAVEREVETSRIERVTFGLTIEEARKIAEARPLGPLGLAPPSPEKEIER